MNYCSIQEAWGHENYISKQYKKYDQKIEKLQTCQKPVIQKKTIENFSEVKKNNKVIKTDTKKSIKIIHCDNFINHLKVCRACQIKVRDQFRPKILDNIEDIIQTNRDIIVLVLVGICIMLFFNLITSTTSSVQQANNNNK